MASVVFAVLKSYVPGWKPYIDFASLALMALDLAVLEPRQERLRTDAARMQELFDCEVLQLPFHSEVAQRPPGEMIHRWASRHPSLHGLRDWYSPTFGTLPPPFARVACQRSGLYWTADIRDHYVMRLRVAAALLVVGVLAGCAAAHAALLTTISWCATVGPLFTWLLREARRQRTAATMSRSLVTRAEKLWGRLRKCDGSDEELRQATRELQTEIFNQRKSSPQMFPWVYRKTRDANEDAMRAGAEHLVWEYRASQRPTVEESVV